MLDCVKYFISEEPSSTACPSRPGGNSANGGSSSGGSNGGSSSNGTSSGGTSTKNCGEYTTSSECPTDRCSWGYHNSSEMHCANKKSCGEYTTSSECPTDRCSWGYHNSSQMHCANKESSNSNKKDCESECNSKYTQGTTAHFHCLDAC